MGVLESVKIRKEGYPIRLEYEIFYKKVILNHFLDNLVSWIRFDEQEIYFWEALENGVWYEGIGEGDIGETVSKDG